MPKYKGGKRKHRGKKYKFENNRKLEFKSEGQEYALLVNDLGNRRFKVLHTVGDNGRTKESIAHIPKKLKWKRLFKDDLVLVNLREYQDGKVDIIYSYTKEESRQLQKYGEIPASFVDSDDSDDDDIIKFVKNSKQKENLKESYSDIYETNDSSDDENINEIKSKQEYEEEQERIQKEFEDL